MGTGTTFAVVIGDNFHFMDEGHEYTQGKHATADSAVEAAKRVVDDFLSGAHVPGMRAAELVQSFSYFGESPFIKSSDGTPVAFSAIEYAHERAAAMTAQ